MVKISTLLLIVGFSCLLACDGSAFCDRGEEEFKKFVDLALIDERSENWAGQFRCLQGVDIEVEAYLSSTSSKMAVRVRSVFGFEKPIYVDLEFKDGDLRLRHTSNETNFNPFFGTNNLVIASYSDRIYLVPVGQMHGFCLEIRAGRIPDCFLSKSLRAGSTKSELNLPKKYESLVKLPEISAKITSQRSSTHFEIDRGTAEGLIVGMLLHSDKYGLFEVLEVFEGKSVVRSLDGKGIVNELLPEGALKTAR